MINRDASDLQIELEHEVERILIRKSLVCPSSKAFEITLLQKQVKAQRLVSISDTGDGSKDSGLDQSELVLGDFVCDFGNVIKGTHKTRSFKVTNTGSLPVSFGITSILISSSLFFD